MLRAWVVGLFLSGAAFGQAEILLKSEKALLIPKVECAAIGADLDISLGEPGDAPGYITLKNFRSVITNSSSRVLKFNVNDESVGSVDLKSGNRQWSVLRAASKDSACEVEVTREAGNQGNDISISLSCRDLVLKNPMTTLAEKSRHLLGSASLSEKISCTIQPEKR